MFNLNVSLADVLSCTYSVRLVTYMYSCNSANVTCFPVLTRRRYNSYHESNCDCSFQGDEKTWAKWKGLAAAESLEASFK